MEMQETFEKLKKLQDNLVEKYKIEDKLRAEPQQVDQWKDLLAEEQKKYLEINAEYEEAKECHSQTRADLDETLHAIEKYDKEMENMSSNREYEALKQQILDANDREKSLRSDLKIHEKRERDLKEKVDELQATIEEYKSSIEESRAAADKNLEKYKAELEKIQKEVEKNTEGLDPEIIFKFERIIRRNSEGIVAVRSNSGGKYGVCTGCHMILPAQFVNEVHEGEKIDFCPYCSRILFYEESEDDGDIYNFDDSGSLIEDDEYDEGDENEGDDGFDDEDGDDSDYETEEADNEEI